MTRRKKVVVYTAASVAGLLVLATVAAITTVKTDWFRKRVRARIVSEIETASGGRAEFGAFTFQWRTMTATIAPFVLHGKEPAGAQPLFRADSIAIGLKIVSALERSVDISSLAVEKPRVNLIVAADGTTNIPGPKVQRSTKNFAEQVIDLAVRKLTLHAGEIQYNSQAFPLDIEADGLSVLLTYDRSGPRYGGSIAATRVRAESNGFGPLAFGFSTSLSLEKNRVQFPDARLNMDKSTIECPGVIQDFAKPRGAFDVRARLFPAGFVKALGLPLEGQGEAAFQGKAIFTTQPANFELSGKLNAAHLAIRADRFSIGDTAVTANVTLTPHRLDVSSLTARALGGSFRGSLFLREWKDLTLDGNASGFSLMDLARATGQPRWNGLTWNGEASGPLHLETQAMRTGFTGTRARATLAIVPLPPGIPMSGHVDLDYDQAAGTLRFGDSSLDTGATQLQFSGTLGQTLHVTAVTKNLDDILPAFAIAGIRAPHPLPVTLKNGSARVEATVTGPIDNPVIVGHVEATNFALDSRDYDRVEADFTLSQSRMNARNVILDKGPIHATGTADVALSEWKIVDASALSATFAIKEVPIADLLAEADSKLPIAGNAALSGAIRGTVAHPQGDGHVSASHVTAYGESADRVEANVSYGNNTLHVARGLATAGGSSVELSGDYVHADNDWQTGKAAFQTTAKAVALASLKHVRDLDQGLDGQADLDGNGTAQIHAGVFELTSLNGKLALRNGAVFGKPWGDLQINASTKAANLALNMSANVRKTKITAGGQWRLEGSYPGVGHLEFSRVTLATLRDLFSKTEPQPLPFEGFVEGSATFSGPLTDFEQVRGTLRLASIQLNPGPELQPRAGAAAGDLILRNSKPVIVDFTGKSFDVKNADFAARNTSLNVTGKVALAATEAFDLHATGAVNLGILQLFNADLLASGNSIITATLRGRPSNPSLSGRLELADASLYLTGLPNGIDKANGVVLFDEHRATIEKLTAETGGGQVALAGFVGLSAGELTYRLQVKAGQVRYRSPQGISITVNAALGVSGTSKSSILSGTVTVLRIGFNPRTDIGDLLAEAARPISTPSIPNEYLRGVQFDVHVEGDENLQLQTSVTSNVQGEIDLRFRGTPERPVILGNVTVNEGEIEFFGNKYSVNRGQVNFFNPAKIEPVIDLDLETRVRAVTVDLVLTGPLNKLNLTYRSDPPLESNQIIALLAVGRDPLNTTDPSTQSSSQSSLLATSTNALLSQAISAPINGRLRRFFGLSHIKVDPQLNDLTSVPQARLTVEQQFSKDVTVTFITNLAKTEDQIIRVEWDLNKNWSAVALRDENGAFGVDFQYRKRFK